jgi:hypothetical protein
MPTEGTPRSSFRLDAATKARLAEIRDYYGLPSDAAAIRHAVARLAIEMGAAQAAVLSTSRAATRSKK